MKAIETLKTIKTIETLKTIKTIETLKTINNMKTINTIMLIFVFIRHLSKFALSFFTKII